MRTRELSAIGAELDRELVGGVIQDVHAPTTTRVYLELRVPGRSCVLLMCAEPQVARISAVEKRPPNPSRPPAWQSVLRRELTGAKVVGVEVMTANRCVLVHLTKGDDTRRLVFDSGGTPGVALLTARGNVLIGRLVEVYCLERDIEFSTYGSWTLEDKELSKGVEPDECYVFGDQAGTPMRPHLAIEVVWTTGGVNKLEIYRELGVQEVWFWRKNALSCHVLREQGYELTTASEMLPGISLNQLVLFLGQPTTSTNAVQIGR